MLTRDNLPSFIINFSEGIGLRKFLECMADCDGLVLADYAEGDGKLGSFNDLKQALDRRVEAKTITNPLRLLALPLEFLFFLLKGIAYLIKYTFC